MPVQLDSDVSIAETSSAPPAGYRGYAGFWLRALAQILDSLLFLVISLVIFTPFAILGAGVRAQAPREELIELLSLTGMMGVALLIAIPGVWLYHALFESSSWQATPGKRLLGLRVVDLEGRPAGFGRASARFFAKPLSSIMYAGYIMVAFTARKQGLHDMIAGTLVVTGPPVPPPPATALTPPPRW